MLSLQMYDAIMRLKSISFNRIFNRTQKLLQALYLSGEKIQKKIATESRKTFNRIFQSQKAKNLFLQTLT